MTATSNIPRDIQESIRDVLDKRVKVSLKQLVKMEIRPDKIENRILALSPCRLFLLTAKVPSKMESSFHFLDIQAIESKKPNQLTLVIDGKAYNFITMDANSDEMDLIITQIGISLKHIFPSFPLERLILNIDVQPSERLKTMNDMIKNVERKEPSPCGGFTTMYQCMCDYHGVPFREEVAWDVDTIYLSHDLKELRLQDFDHLNGKDLVPIIGALEHNTWFKIFNASSVKLTVESCNEVIKVMKRNAVLEEVNLSNTGIKPEFVQKLAWAIISNSGSQITSLDLSNNLLDDKAISHLMGAVKLLPCGLTSFDISRTGITTRCLNKVGEVLAQAPNVMGSLSVLKINDNGMKGEDFPMLYNFLAQPNGITFLDLSSTDCTLDALCDPLLRGCPNLMTLKVSKTLFTHKRNKDVSVPLSWKQFFSSTCSLEHLDLSNCRLPVEALKDLMLGLSSNRQIKGIYLDLSSNEFGMAGANVLASCISSVNTIKGLDISNNGFDNDLKSLLLEIAKNPHIKHLSLGQNFANVKPKYMPELMDALTHVLQEETCTLESLSLADSKLKTDTTYIINALGSNLSLLEIDISGNMIGDLGARLLAKALLVNTKLSKVVWDRNNVSAQGFEDVAEALHRNMTLRKMPYPVNDAAAALRMYPERTETALQKIESLLQRNHSPRKFASDNAYRLQQGFLISSTQNMVDRLVVHIEDTVNALSSMGTTDSYADDLKNANTLVKDANNVRQLFSGLQDIAIKSQAKGNPVDVLLQEMAGSLKNTIEQHIQKTASDMLICALNCCPAIMSDHMIQARIKEDCLSNSILPKDFTHGLLEGASTDIYNMSSEKNLENAARISDSVIDLVIDSLTSSQKTLTNHLTLRKSGHTKVNERDKVEESDEASRRKNTEQISPHLVNKRKSLLTRKSRPQSIVGDVVPISSNKSIENKAGLQSLEEAGSEGTASERVEKSVNFVDLPSLSRPLEHITKGRPKREKMHRPTRPIVAAGTTEFEENNGPHPGYQSQLSHSAQQNDVAKENTEGVTETTHKFEPLKSKLEIKPDDSSSKKWIPAFMKKSKEDKLDKEGKDVKKSSSFGFSNIFKKKDDKRRPSAPDSTDNTVDGSVLNVVQEPIKVKVADVLEVVTEVEHVPVGTDDAVNRTDTASDLDSSPDKLPVKSPKARVAILPPFKRLEAPRSILATGEDTSLEDIVDDLKDAATLAVAAAPSSNTEPNKDEIVKLPAGLSKTSGISVLGGKDLLQEMKMKQEKRSSRSPLLWEDEKVALNDSADKETGKKAENKNQGNQQSGEIKKISPSTKHKEPPLSADDLSKKDVNDNTSDTHPSCLSAKSTHHPQTGAVPTHGPRTVNLSKRPVSTVEECIVSLDPPSQAMITSTPELLFEDNTGIKPRPTPPVKPRPPIIPRLKKSGSGKDNATENFPAIVSETSAEKQTLASTTEAQNAEVASPELRSKPGAQEEGIVTDSATLRLSVKDKIKRLSQAKCLSNNQTHVPQVFRQKTGSLPRDTQIQSKDMQPQGDMDRQLQANMPEDSEDMSKLVSVRNETRTSEIPSSTLEEVDRPNLGDKSDSPKVGEPDDEIMV